MSDALQILESRADWQRASEQAQDAAIGAVLAELGQGFSQRGTTRYEVGGQAHRVATLRHDPSGIELQLLPGGGVVCGALEERAFEQVENWWSEDKLDFTYDRALVRNAQVTPFLLSREPLTAEQWRALGGASDAGDVLAQADWSDAQACLEATPFALPTEAQWEYACRAGTDTRHWWGDAFNADLAVCEADAPPTSRELAPNGFGLVGMLGWRWEWTADEYVSTYRSKVDEEPGEDRYHMLRGGSWRSASDRCRCASFREVPAGEALRQAPAEDDRDRVRLDEVGLRVALTLIRPYSPNRSFVAGETLSHARFGRGVVRHMNQREVEVAFADGETRRLAHGLPPSP